MENSVTQKKQYDPKQDIFYKLLKWTLNIYKTMGVLLVLGAFGLILASNIPGFEYFLFPDASSVEKNTLLETVSAEEASKGNADKDESALVINKVQSSEDMKFAQKLPDIDPNLPVKPWLKIPAIGVDAEIHLGDEDASLDLGVTKFSDYGDPMSNLPVVLASHRYGLLSWGNERSKKWFYKLPELKPGDDIYIIWNQRQFHYKVTRQAEGTGTVNLSENLMLFACKAIKSPYRIMVFANRV